MRSVLYFFDLFASSWFVICNLVFDLFVDLFLMCFCSFCCLLLLLVAVVCCCCFLLLFDLVAVLKSSWCFFLFLFFTAASGGSHGCRLARKHGQRRGNRVSSQQKTSRNMQKNKKCHAKEKDAMV